MDTRTLLELFGYLGSCMVVVSMLMTSVVKLRIINALGSLISGIYALLVGAVPLMLMNGCLVVINVFNLVKLLKSEQDYDLLRSDEKDASVQYFLSRYMEDIQSFFPDFPAQGVLLDTVYLVYCQGSLAGILMGRTPEEGKLDVYLDYTTPAYRDCSAGRYLYARLAVQGVKQLRYARKNTPAHEAYLSKMGFTQENGTYIKNL